MRVSEGLGPKGKAKVALEFEGGEELGEVRFELAEGLLPLTCGNFSGRLSALSIGCVERVEKGVGVMFSVVDSLAPGADRELRREVDICLPEFKDNVDEEEEAEEVSVSRSGDL